VVLPSRLVMRCPHQPCHLLPTCPPEYIISTIPCRYTSRCWFFCTAGLCTVCSPTLITSSSDTTCTLKYKHAVLCPDATTTKDESGSSSPSPESATDANDPSCSTFRYASPVQRPAVPTHDCTGQPASAGGDAYTTESTTESGYSRSGDGWPAGNYGTVCNVSIPSQL